MSVASLEPYIRQILFAPGTDLNTISAKRVRKQLLELHPSISVDWVKSNKEDVDKLIARVFEAVSTQLAAEANSDSYQTKRKRETDGDEVVKEENDDDDGINGDDRSEDSASSHHHHKPKKTKTKQELADEEYARRLSSEINGRSSRSVRNGRPKKASSRTPKRSKKSAEQVDSDSEENSDVDKKRKRKSSGGGAKGGFQKEFYLSEPLAALLQVRKLSRPQVVKQLWVHIKGNQLQKPNDKRKIVCDEPMRAIFNTDEIDMFKMNKVLGQHLHEEGE